MGWHLRIRDVRRRERCMWAEVERGIWEQSGAKAGPFTMGGRWLDGKNLRKRERRRNAQCRVEGQWRSCVLWSGDQMVEIRWNNTEMVIIIQIEHSYLFFYGWKSHDSEKLHNSPTVTELIQGAEAEAHVFWIWVSVPLTLWCLELDYHKS